MSVVKPTLYPNFNLFLPPTNPEMTDTDSEKLEHPGADSLFSEAPQSCTIHILPLRPSKGSIEDVILAAQGLVQKTLGQKNEFEGIRAAYKYVYGLPQNASLLKTTSKELGEQLAALRKQEQDSINERDKIARHYSKYLETYGKPLDSKRLIDYTRLMSQVHKNLQFYKDVNATQVRIQNLSSLNIPLSAYKCSSVACCLLKGIFCEILCLQCCCNDYSFTLEHAKLYEARYGSCCLLTQYQKCVLYDSDKDDSC